MTRDELECKLLANSTAVDGGCRRWTGAHTQKGYGHISIAGKARQVHRVAHEVWIGPIPDGHDVDHVHARGCRHRDCIEPSHLEAITHAENVRRAAELITHCPNDHEYTPDNIRWVRPKPGCVNRRRECRTCFNAARRALRAKKRGLSPAGGFTNA
jgi:hypothetical protein